MHCVNIGGRSLIHKRRKKRKSETATEAQETSSIRQLSLAIGLSSGSLTIFSALQGEVTHALSSPKYQSSILSLSPAEPKRGADIIGTWSKNGFLQAWDIRLGRLVNSWASYWHRPYALFCHFLLVIRGRAHEQATRCASHHQACQRCSIRERWR